MVRLTAILLFSLHLLANTELCQLAKLPVLVSHFKEHKALYGEISFTDFLQMHYFNGAPHDNTDLELPFKTTSVELTLHNSCSAPVPAITSIPLANFAEIHFRFNEFYETFIPSTCNEDIFQPPQFA